MKRRRQAQPGPAPAGIPPVRTGEHCPESGWWYPLQSDSQEPVTPARFATLASRFIGQGSVMPAVGGAPSLWLPSQTR